MDGALVRIAIEQVDDHYLQRAEFSRSSWSVIIRTLTELFPDKAPKFVKNKLLSHFKEVLSKDHQVWLDIKTNAVGVKWNEDDFCFETDPSIDTLAGFFSGLGPNLQVFYRNKKKLSIMKLMFMSNICYYLDWFDKYLYGPRNLRIVDYLHLHLVPPRLARCNYNSEIFSKSSQFKKVADKDNLDSQNLFPSLYEYSQQDPFLHTLLYSLAPSYYFPGTVSAPPTANYESPIPMANSNYAFPLPAFPITSPLNYSQTTSGYEPFQFPAWNEGSSQSVESNHTTNTHKNLTLTSIVHEMHHLDLISIDAVVLYCEYIDTNKAQQVNEILLNPAINMTHKVLCLNSFILSVLLWNSEYSGKGSSSDSFGSFAKA